MQTQPSSRSFIFSVLLAAAIGLIPVGAQAMPKTAVVAQVGTLGAGGAVYLGLPHSADVRLGGNYFSLSHAVNSGGVRYDGSVRLETFLLLADWHPFHGYFRLTAGGVYNLNKIGLTATPQSGNTYTINGNVYTSSQVGSLIGNATWNRVNPYFGFGFGNPFRGGHWTFGVDLGVIYQGSPNVDLYATNPQAGAQLQSDIDQARAQAQATLSKYTKWVPVAVVSVGYRF